jgi:hypothetical protein
MSSIARLLLLVLAASALAAESRAASYVLNSRSTFTRGCYDPCDCPIFSIEGVSGSFDLTPLDVTPLFRTFEVLDLDLTVPLPEPLHVTGSGTYRVGGEFAIVHQLELDLELDPGVVQHFDSGLVPGGGEFPRIQVAVSMNGMVCFDTVFDIDARPAPEPRFTRSDCNADGSIIDGFRCDLSDSIFLLNFLFRGGPRPPCLEACNANDDEALDVSDAVYGLGFCFRGGAAPPPPFPECGRDPTPSTSCSEFPPCDAFLCAPQRVRAVGPCALFLGYHWDGRSCRPLSGCSCEGADCAELYATVEECEADRATCPPCEPLDARGVGDCEAVLGYAWNGRECLAVVGCECEGADCGRLASLEECLAVHRGCPDPCAPMDVGGLGPCDAVLGYYWDGFRCQALTGCECVGEDCSRLYDSEGACAIARVFNNICPGVCSPMRVRAVGDCEVILGSWWDGARCVPLIGCDCEGVDCERLVPFEYCLEVHADCPPPCVPMDVREVGNCEPIHGYYWDGTSCRVLSGCTCEGADCERLFGSLGECLEVNAGCPAPR